MLASLASLVVALTPPGDVQPPEAFDAPPKGTHTEAAHETLRVKVRTQLLPNLRSYESLASAVVERLAFMEDVDRIREDLDRLRGGRWTHALENTIPGFGWLTDGYDAIGKLVARVSRVKRDLATLAADSGELAQTAERYSASPCNETFRVLRLGFEDTRPTFTRARTSLRELDGFLLKSSDILEKSARVVGNATDFPFLGSQAAELEVKLSGLAAKARAARAILDVTREAIERDERTIDELQGSLNCAHAHDAWVDADRLTSTGNPGSALAAFRALRVRWPDTVWAHKADQQIVDLTDYLDDLQTEAVGLRQEVATLRAAAAERPEVVVRPVERTRVVPVVEREGAGPLPWVVAVALGLCGLALGLWRRRAT